MRRRAHHRVRVAAKTGRGRGIVPDMDELVENMLDSLGRFERETVREREAGKALKDVVGASFEAHRKRFYEMLGFDVVTDHLKAQCPWLGFNADMVVLKGSRVVVVEESKGHYTDAPFLKRALVGFAESTSNFLEKGGSSDDLPYFAVGSVTRPGKLDDHLKRFLRLLHPDLATALQERFRYWSLFNRDRLQASDWFNGKRGGGNDSPITRSEHVEDLKENVADEIRFLQRLG
jgi:hypothetical protein